ncbi:putative ABC transport system permease protein [Microbulbifer donghaiensis]|uniref:Putative ABC transport system permease protein n=1 Tax=Microbulbifer donghaiensis TaxID=494016 RepID=A0A1M5DVS0_9GAMM|nr:FtsX-like permease family protein [Microbulbifer donghaiensis]SHF71016.1 putative ABC transport system permease protein [Microbulbifer donghaiensis]
MGLGTVFLSHYRRHPGQLAGLLLILICAAMLWSGVRSLTGRAEEAVTQSKAALEPRLSVLRADGRAVDVEDFARLRRAALCASPRLHVTLPAEEAPEILGIDPFTAGCLRQYSVGAPVTDTLVAGLDRRVLLGSAGDLARWRQLAPPGTGDYRLDETEGLPAGVLLTDIAVAAELASAGRATLEILLPAAELDRLQLPAGYRAQIEDYGVEPDPLVEAFLLNLNALGALALLVAALLVRSVYRFALEQRRRSLEILGRFGVPTSQLRLALVAEVLLLALIGASFGVWLGARLAAAMAEGFKGTLSGLFSVDTLAQSPPAVETWLGMVLILAVVVGWACVDLLMLRRRGQPGATPSEKQVALIPLPPMQLPRFLVPAVLLPATLLIVSLAVLLATEQLSLIFLATTGCLIGAGLLLPRLLNWLLARAERRCRQALLEWSCAEMRALCRLLQLPLVALAFAIAAAIGVQTMVAGFEATFARWLDQRLQGDLYLDPGRPVAATDWDGRLRALPGVKTVLPMVRGRGLVDGLPVDVLGVHPNSPLVQDWPFLAAVADPWRALEERGILINEQLARRQSLALGDEIHFRLGAEAQSRQVIGIYADYGRPEGELMLSLAILPDALPRRYTTFVLGVNDPGGIHWQDWPGRYPWLAGGRLRDQAGLKRAANAAFARTFQMTRLLNGLTLSLAGAALALMGLVIFRLRQRSYTLLHVYGVPRRRLRRRLIVHSMLITGLLGLLATPLGIFLSWVLVAKVNPAAFGWALPLKLYPGFWLQVWLVCLLIGASVGALMRDPVRLETLKNE